MIRPHAWHGGGEPLVLLAGLGAKGTSWQPFLSRAAAEHRVLTFDNRGAGQAPPLDGPVTLRALAADALAILDQLGIERAPIVGRSMGGMIAQELALLAPERVSALVLASTTGRADAHLAHVFGLWAEMAEQEVPARIRHRNSLLWCLGSSALEGDARVQAYLDARARGDRPLDYARQARACAEHDALERLRALAVPTLVIAGSDDRLTPAPHAEALAKAIPSAELCLLPGAGHLAYLETPERFGAAVLAFLRAHAPSEGETACRVTSARIPS